MTKNIVKQTRQNLTKPDDFNETERLTPAMIQAIDALSTGENITGAAEKANVSRQTVSGWLNHDAGFQSALGQRRAALWRASVVELRWLVTEAIAALRSELRSGERRLQAAKMILELSGFTSATPISKPDKGYLDDDDMPRIPPLTNADIMKMLRGGDESDESESN